MAIAAPWAMLGEVAWAASPIRTTRPFTHDGRVTSSIGEKYGGSAEDSRRRMAGTGS